MIIPDTSTILAILLEEEAASFCDRIGEAGGAMVSAGTAVELAAVVSRDADLFSTARAFLDEPFISVEPLDAEQAVAAGDAYRRYGKGHRASIWAMSSPTRLPGGGISRCCPRRGFHSRRYRRSLSETVFGPKLKVCESSGEGAPAAAEGRLSEGEKGAERRLVGTRYQCLSIPMSSNTMSLETRQACSTRA